jgi:SAM-dependent methyltransferase
MADYFFDQRWEQERRRLEAYAEMYDPGTIAELTRIGVGPGWSCLEVGAGTGTIATWLAERAGPGGRVVATDIDPRFLGELDPAIEVRRHDIAVDPLEANQYDVIHTRAVIEHVAARDGALGSMVRALRPGGWLLLEEIVRPPSNCFPALPPLKRIFDGMDELLRRRGGDTETGLWLPGAMTAAGLQDVTCEPRVLMVYSGTRSIELMTLSIEYAGPRLVDLGALTQDELQAAIAAFKAPGFTMLSAVMIAARGRAPS